MSLATTELVVPASLSVRPDGQPFQMIGGPSSTDRMFWVYRHLFCWRVPQVPTTNGPGPQDAGVTDLSPGQSSRKLVLLGRGDTLGRGSSDVAANVTASPLKCNP